MKIQITRSSHRTIISTEGGGAGQSLREVIGEIATTHWSWVGKWEDSKPVTRKDQQQLKEEMLKLAAEAGLI